MKTRRAGRNTMPLALAALLLLAVTSNGCQLFGYIAGAGFGGDDGKKVEVEAEYLGLQGKTTAVMVNSDEFTLYQHPSAPLKVCRSVCERFKVDLANARVTDPDQLIKWQQDHPHWSTLRYSELIHKINVDRIVYIDLVEYSTHDEPGNKYQLRGTIMANVSVIEAPGPDGKGGSGDNFAYSTTVRSRFPEDNPVGMLDADEQMVEYGVLANFSQSVSGLFHLHQETIKP